MAVVAKVATGVVAETEVASLRRVDLHTTTSAPVVLGSKVLLDIPVRYRNSCYSCLQNFVFILFECGHYIILHVHNYVYKFY